MLFIRLNRDASSTVNVGGVSGNTDGTGSASATGAASGASAAAPAAGQTPAFVIPDAYKDRPYLKGVDSPDKVFEMLDGAQKLIGQRPAGIPAQDAPPEEWEKFYDAVGRPKDPKEYSYTPVEGIPQDPKVLDAMKPILHKAGITPAQLKILGPGFDQVMTALAKEKGIEIQTQNANFDQLANDVFGADRDKALARSKGLIDSLTPEKMKPEVAKLSNEALIVMAGVLNAVHQKYIREDGAPNAGAPAASGNTEAEIRAQGQALMMKPEYNDPFHPNHAAVLKQVQDLYTRLGKK